MTDTKLIDALKCCADYTPGCVKCPLIFDDDCRLNMKELAANRLEALIAERDFFRDLAEKRRCEKRYVGYNEWVSVNDRLPESADHSVLVVVSGVCENTNGGCVIAFHDAIEIATYYRDCGGWLVEAYPYWENPNVTYWQYPPEPPSTEGVE